MHNGDSRIVIPPQGQRTMLNELHEVHPGICHMKAPVRCHICRQIWMPTFKAVENCQICQVNCKALEKASLYPWEHTDDPWVCLHVHYAMPFLNKMFLIIIDSHSKWKDICVLTDWTTKTMIDCLSKRLATFGDPVQILCDILAAVLQARSTNSTYRVMV